MKPLIEYLVKSLVDDPDSVSIEELLGDGHIKYQVYVSAEDIGKVIGKNGRIANALRTVAKAAAMKHKQKIYVEIVTV